MKQIIQYVIWILKGQPPLPTNQELRNLALAKWSK